MNDHDNDVFEAEEVGTTTPAFSLTKRVEIPEVVQAMEAAMHRAAEKARLELELKWEEERKERERWKLEDKRDVFFARLVAHMAGACLSEGATGVRPKPEHVAELAVAMANAVMKEIDKDLKRKQEAAEAARMAAEAVLKTASTPEK